MRKIDRTGEVAYNNFGSKMIVTRYGNANDMDVHFPKYNYTKEHVRYTHFIEGNIKCVYERRYYNKGYLGEGKYKVKINGKHTKHYITWQSMLERCYDSKVIERCPTYKGCRVHDSWHNFQVFGEWIDKNYYEIEGQRMEIDKDILCKGNKIYSPQTCVFVPHRINSLFIKTDKCRGDLPIGVVYANKKYRVYCNMGEKRKHLGYYDSPEEAFQAYKNFKEQYIKEVAEEYKDKIPSKLYNAMIKYEIEIDD